MRAARTAMTSVMLAILPSAVSPKIVVNPGARHD
jgi:hypothetical protein